MDKISSFRGKKKAKKLHFSRARGEYSRSALLSAFVRVEQTRKTNSVGAFCHVLSTLASSFSVFVFDYGTKTNGNGKRIQTTQKQSWKKTIDSYA